ncbi:PadR family transcriptional regulator [Kutzneria albida]|uniref:Transcription regulator PadR N-terminal domain-containing protein n=1 Tax=Kutzneria albida DSM 43870 TaxID=1449976 RepID=W5W7U8_9PSEU|nr:PadR family transcriptional regulator [Kutzneria albida]AHH96800.1 hypothetical protein KALB_3433 [Kutzneria albida DSM 43870]
MKRKISNPLALAVLGLLLERPMHPYEIGVTLKDRYKGGSFKITNGSLYDVVQALEREGWIGEREVVKDGKRPERTIYQQTDLGRAEFVRWVDELLRVPINEYPKFVAAVTYLGALPKPQAIDALSERAGHVREHIAKSEEVLRAVLEDRGTPRLFMIEVEYALSMARAELDWIGATIEEIADGTLLWPTDEAWTWTPEGEQ